MPGTASRSLKCDVIYPVVLAIEPLSVDGGLERGWSVSVFQEADKGCLLLRGCGHVAEDVCGGFDESLFHDTITQVSQDHKVTAKKDVPSPSLEGLEEHPGTRRDGSNIASTGLTQF